MKKACLIGILAFLAVGVLAYALSTNQPNKSKTPNPDNRTKTTSTVPATSTPTSVLDTKSWKEYKNATYSLKFKYPEYWTLATSTPGYATFIPKPAQQQESQPGTAPALQLIVYPNIIGWGGGYIPQGTKNINNLQDFINYTQARRAEGLYYPFTFVADTSIDEVKIHYLDETGDLGTGHDVMFERENHEVVLLMFGPRVSDQERNNILGTLRLMFVTSTLSAKLPEVYTNTKYGYRFRYSKGNEPTVCTEYGSPCGFPAESDSGLVYGAGITVNAAAIPDLTEQNIRRAFMGPPESITPLRIFNTSAYKVTFAKAEKVPYESYFVQKPGGTVFEIDVTKNSTLSEDTFKTFEFIE